MEWAPSVLRTTIEEDYDGVSIARVNLSKALAAGAVAARDEFWQDWETFHFLCQALNNNIPSHEELQEHTVGQMMVAVDIATRIRKSLGDLSHVPEFSEQVARYIAAQALNQGVWYLPAPLEFAGKYAAKRWYKCKDCGSEGEVVFEDELCDTCVDRYNTDSLKDWTPCKHLKKKGRGQNIIIFEKNPTARVKARFEKKITFPNTMLQETQEDICAARLLVAVQYMSHRRTQEAAWMF